MNIQMTMKMSEKSGKKLNPGIVITTTMTGVTDNFKKTAWQFAKLFLFFYCNEKSIAKSNWMLWALSWNE